MRRGFLLLWFIFSFTMLQAQNLLWEKTFGTPNREQQFTEGIDMGNAIYLLAGQNRDQYIAYPSGQGYMLRYWQLIDGHTGDTFRTRYWDPRYWGFPYPVEIGRAHV